MLVHSIPNYHFNEETRLNIYNNLSNFEDVRQPLEGHRHAAVAVTISEHENECSVIVTRRSSSLKEHTGQWALPGGRIDDGEDCIEAALRELKEEINLNLSPQHVLGTLDDYLTRSGYVITPVVVWANDTIEEMKPNPGEVESIHPFTFKELARLDSPNLESIPQSDRQVLSMNYHDDVIYAPTAAMLYQFREVAINGKATKVLDYDQPLFAWN